MCDPARASQLYEQADAAGREVECVRFYYGIGVRADAARARACLQRQVTRAGACNSGSSPSMEQSYLAIMLADAQGGSRDIDGATRVLAGCEEDMGVQNLRAAIAKRRARPSLANGSLEFCRDTAGTSLDSNACMWLDVQRAYAARQSAGWKTAAALDDTGKELYGRAAKAWSDVASRDAAVAGDVVGGGTMRPSVELAETAADERARAEDLARIDAYQLGTANPNAERELERAYNAALARAGDDEGRMILKAANDAFGIYREAEVALYRRVLGAKLGADAVERDVRARLAIARRKKLDAQGALP